MVSSMQYEDYYIKAKWATLKVLILNMLRGLGRNTKKLKRKQGHNGGVSQNRIFAPHPSSKSDKKITSSLSEFSARFSWKFLNLVHDLVLKVLLHNFLQIKYYKRDGHNCVVDHLVLVRDLLNNFFQIKYCKLDGHNCIVNHLVLVRDLPSGPPATVRLAVDNPNFTKLNVRSVRLGLVGILIDLRWNVEETELFVQGLNGKHGFVTLRKIFSVCKRNKIKILF